MATESCLPSSTVGGGGRGGYGRDDTSSRTPIIVPEAEAKGLEDYLSDTEYYVEDFLPPEKDLTFPCTVLVGNTPVAPEGAIDKLKTFLIKKVSTFGECQSCDIVIDEDGKQPGMVFMTFATPEDAHNVVEKFNNFPLDKTHRARTMMLDDLDALLTRDEEYKPPDQLAYFSRANTRWWLKDEKKRSQFMLRHGPDSVEIFWHDPIERQPAVIKTRRNAKGWTESHAIWSPWGSYLATYHSKGIMIYIGPEFERVMRFEHPDVQDCSFSPNEEFLLTWDGSPSTQKRQDAVRIYKIQTGEFVCSLKTPDKSPRNPHCNFPHFLWSHDSSLFASLNTLGDVYVYCSETMQLLERDKKRQALKFATAVDKFEWSPSDLVLALWHPEKGDNPGRLVLMEMPTRKELATKNVFQVRSAELHWHVRGDFLCLIIERVGKNKKPGPTQLEIFSMREKNVPVEMVELDVVIKEFSWEKGGSGFSVLAEDKNMKTVVQFYQQQLQKGKNWEKTFQLSDLPYQINHIKWSPAGPHFVMAAFGSEGLLYFGTLSNEGKQVDITHKNEHYMMNTLVWDPTGRFVASACKASLDRHDAAHDRFSSESGYAVWTFQGRIQYRFQKEKLYEIAWRNHPPCLLPIKQLQEIKKNLKDYSKAYDRVDDEQKNAKKNEFFGERNERIAHFLEMLNELATVRREHPAYDAWEDALDELEDQYEFEDREEAYEELVSRQEEVVDK